MPIIPKIAGGAGIVSSVVDIHKTALIHARNEAAVYSSNSILSTSLGAQKADRLSVADADKKNWINQKSFLAGPSGVLGALKGYFKGIKEGVVIHWPKLLLSLSAFIFKKEIPSYLSTAALGIYAVYEFIKHSTSIFEKTDYLKFK